MNTGVRDPVTKQMFPTMEALERARKKKEAKEQPKPLPKKVKVEKKKKPIYRKPKIEPKKVAPKEVKANGNS